jgi:hypothetical protein
LNNISLCENCGKETEFILLDSEDGQSLAFCCWKCLSKWDIDRRHKLRQTNGHRGRIKGTRIKDTHNYRGRIKGTQTEKVKKKIPEVIAQKKQGESIRQIMKTTGLVKNTVRSIINNPTPLEDYEPGCTREEFFGVLKKVSRPLKERHEKS